MGDRGLGSRVGQGYGARAGQGRIGQGPGRVRVGSGQRLGRAPDGPHFFVTVGVVARSNLIWDIQSFFGLGVFEPRKLEKRLGVSDFPLGVVCWDRPKSKNLVFQPFSFSGFSGQIFFEEWVGE